MSGKRAKAIRKAHIDLMKKGSFPPFTANKVYRRYTRMTAVEKGVFNKKLAQAQLHEKA